jgi:hypothetical protein
MIFEQQKNASKHPSNRGADETGVEFDADKTD